MKLKSLKIHRFIECRNVFFENFSSGVNVIYGPNSAGKSVTCRSIKALLWPENIKGTSLESIWIFNDAETRISLEGADHEILEEIREVLPNEVNSNAYLLTVDDLFAATDKQYADKITNESFGGYDLSSLKSPSITKKTGITEFKECNLAKKEINRILTFFKELQQQEEELKILEEEIEKSKNARAEIELLQKLLKNRKELELIKQEKEKITFQRAPTLEQINAYRLLAEELFQNENVLNVREKELEKAKAILREAGRFINHEKSFFEVNKFGEIQEIYKLYEELEIVKGKQKEVEIRKEAGLKAGGFKKIYLIALFPLLLLPFWNSNFILPVGVVALALILIFLFAGASEKGDLKEREKLYLKQFLKLEDELAKFSLKADMSEKLFLDEFKEGREKFKDILEIENEILALKAKCQSFFKQLNDFFTAYELEGISRAKEANLALNKLTESEKAFSNAKTLMNSLISRQKKLEEQINDQTTLEIEERLVLLEMQAQKFRELIQKQATIESEIQRVKNEKKLQEAQGKFFDAQEKLKKVFSEVCFNEIANFWLDELAQNYKAQTQGQLFNLSKDFLHRFTKGRYLLKDNLEIHDTLLKSNKALEMLSRGTRMQLILAIRLGFASLNEKEKLPFFFDEALNSSDDFRFEAIADSLFEMASEGRQIFYFTCKLADIAFWEKKAHSLNQPIHIHKFA